MVIDQHGASLPPLVAAWTLVTAIQLAHDIVQRKIPLPQQHEQMIDQIADFQTKLIIIAVLGGNDGFGGLFANFFQNLIDALLEQVRGIGTFRAFLVTLLDNLLQFTKHLETAGGRCGSSYGISTLDSSR
ncbi:hypothetical protein D3C84_1035080 [compost metagenome]